MAYFQTVSDTVRDHFLDEANLRWVRVVVDPTGTPATYVPVDISCDATEDYQKWSFDIKNRAGLSVGLHANLPCVVSFSHNGSDWVVAFTGFVSDDGFRRTRGIITDDYLSIDLVDATKRKGTKRKPNMALLSGFKIVNKTTTASSILHYLATLMGATVETVDITLTKTLVEIGKDTVWSELQKLKEAFHADMYFRFDGKLLFRSPLEDSYSAPTPEWTFQGDPSVSVTGAACRIKGKVEEVYLPVRCNYGKTDFDDLEALSAQVIYKNTEGYNAASDAITIEIAAGAYFPGPKVADVARLEYQDPENGEKFPFAISVDTPTLGAFGSGTDIESTGGALEIVSFNGSTAATSQNADSSEIILWNNSASATTIRKLTISGTPYRKKADEIVEYPDPAVTDAVDYVELSIDGKYMIDASQAFDTLYHIVQEGKGRPRQFRFSAPWMPWIQRAAIITVQMPSEDSVRCRIDTYQHKNRGRTLQGMFTTLTCTQLGEHVPSGDPELIIRPQVPAWQAKLTNISPNAGATYNLDSDEPPSNPRMGDWWYQPDTQIYKRYSGTGWENVGGSALIPSLTAEIAFESASKRVKLYDDGSFEFGNYNETTKSGGILYDNTEDKLYGNVAYDQWDLVIESDADLAKLTTGATTYKNVLVAPGTWTTEVQIDLDAHGVERFVGISKNDSIIDLDYAGTATTPMIVCGATTEISNIKFISSTTQTVSNFYIIGFPSLSTAYLHNCIFYDFDSKGYAIHGASSGLVEKITVYKTNQGVYLVDKVSDSIAQSCAVGFSALDQIVNCRANNCTSYGFRSISSCVGCYAFGNATGFDNCYNISGCISFNNTTYGFSECDRISSSQTNGNGTDWYVNTFVDYDSTNCNQQWTYGNSGANVTTSGWVIPKGTYQMVKSSASAAVYLQVYDGSSWIQAGGAISSTSAYAGIITSDGTNFRLSSSEGTQTVYWRKKP